MKRTGVKKRWKKKKISGVKRYNARRPKGLVLPLPCGTVSLLSVFCFSLVAVTDGIRYGTSEVARDRPDRGVKEGGSWE